MYKRQHKWGKFCRQCNGCYTRCPDFEELKCLKLQKPPYVCNGCKERSGCKLKRHLYDTKFDQTEYEAVRSESRKGFATEPAELRRIDSIISPLIKQGQSIHQICTNNADLIMLDERTIYNYIDAGPVSYTHLKKLLTGRLDLLIDNGEMDNAVFDRQFFCKEHLLSLIHI